MTPAPRATLGDLFEQIQRVAVQPIAAACCRQGMRARLLAIACVYAVQLGHAAAGTPTPQDLESRKAALDKKLAGQGYTILIEGPYVIIGDESPARVKKTATGFFRWTYTLLEKDFFARRPDKLIEVWLFKNEKSFRKGAKKFFNDDPETPYGYYSPSADALIMNVTGLGTLSHEMVHPYIEANFPEGPSWFNEGLASLFEQPGEKQGHIVGGVNWRLPNLKREIRAKTLPELKTLLGTTRDGFYEAEFDAYAYARYLLYYLQEKGKLHEFWEKFLADKKDLTGQNALEAVLGQDLATFEPIWRKWALALSK